MKLKIAFLFIALLAFASAASAQSSDAACSQINYDGTVNPVSVLHLHLDESAKQVTFRWYANDGVTVKAVFGSDAIEWDSPTNNDTYSLDRPTGVLTQTVDTHDQFGNPSRAYRHFKCKPATNIF